MERQFQLSESAPSPGLFSTAWRRWDFFSVRSQVHPYRCESPAGPWELCGVNTTELCGVRCSPFTYSSPSGGKPKSLTQAGRWVSKQRFFHIRDQLVVCLFSEFQKSGVIWVQRGSLWEQGWGRGSKEKIESIKNMPSVFMLLIRPALNQYWYGLNNWSFL